MKGAYMNTSIVAARRMTVLMLVAVVSALGAEPGVEKPGHQEPNIAIQGF